MTSGGFSDHATIYKNESTASKQIEDADVYLPIKDDGDFGNNGNKNCDTKYRKEKDETCIALKDTSISNQTGKKIGHKRIHSDGGISYKKINTLQIMESVQLGIQTSVGSQSSQPERDVLMVDFMTVESTPFSTETSTNRNPEFIFKTYAPVAFRHLRDLFGIEPGHFVTSFCQAPLLELTNAGASGSIFYVTRNDDFIIKTVQHKEAVFLQKLLPGYFLNLSQNPHTLLPKFFGLYCYKRNMTNVRLVAMNNVLPSDITISYKYDLKGSTYMRKASNTDLKNSSPTYKDLDFMQHHPNGIYLNADVYKNLMKTIQRDCRVLESFRIMDYSLLLGIHNVGDVKQEAYNKNVEDEHCAKDEQYNNPSGGDGNYTPCEAENRLRKCTDIKTQSDERCSTEKVKDIKERQARFELSKHTINVPLTGIPAHKANGEQLLLYVGIIDILQSYRFKKKVEHFLKSIVYESGEISVHNPAFYARRFENFLAQRVFKISPSSPKSKQKNTPLLKSDSKKIEQ